MENMKIIKVLFDYSIKINNKRGEPNKVELEKFEKELAKINRNILLNISIYFSEKYRIKDTNIIVLFYLYKTSTTIEEKEKIKHGMIKTLNQKYIKDALTLFETKNKVEYEKLFKSIIKNITFDIKESQAIDSEDSDFEIDSSTPKTILENINLISLDSEEKVNSFNQRIRLILQNQSIYNEIALPKLLYANFIDSEENRIKKEILNKYTSHFIQQFSKISKSKKINIAIDISLKNKDKIKSFNESLQLSSFIKFGHNDTNIFIKKDTLYFKINFPEILEPGVCNLYEFLIKTTFNLENAIQNNILTQVKSIPLSDIVIGISDKSPNKNISLLKNSGEYIYINTKEITNKFSIRFNSKKNYWLLTGNFDKIFNFIYEYFIMYYENVPEISFYLPRAIRQKIIA